MRRGLNEDVFMSDTAELETKLAFVEDTVRALDAALATQQQHMLQLQQELDALRIRLREQGTRMDAITPGGKSRRLPLLSRNPDKKLCERIIMTWRVALLVTSALLGGVLVLVAIVTRPPAARPRFTSMVWS